MVIAHSPSVVTEIYLRRADNNRIPMVLEVLLPALIGFVFVMLAAYAGALRALEVYFDPDQDSIFLSNDVEPPSDQ
jgi:hypothetical protein